MILFIYFKILLVYHWFTMLTSVVQQSDSVIHIYNLSSYFAYDFRQVPRSSLLFYGLVY